MGIGIQPGKDAQNFLFVDEHAGFRRTIRAFLTEGAVSECSDGRDVPKCYAIEHPDRVLMDIEMSGMDRLTTTRRLPRKFPETR
jgi:DNA-binding NarL/FixJ family response regulator